MQSCSDITCGSTLILHVFTTPSPWHFFVVDSQSWVGLEELNVKLGSVDVLSDAAADGSFDGIADGWSDSLLDGFTDGWSDGWSDGLGIVEIEIKGLVEAEGDEEGCGVGHGRNS